MSHALRQVEKEVSDFLFREFGVSVEVTTTVDGWDFWGRIEEVVKAADCVSDLEIMACIGYDHDKDSPTHGTCHMVRKDAD